MQAVAMTRMHLSALLLSSLLVGACSKGDADPNTTDAAAMGDGAVPPDAHALTMFPVAGETARAPVILDADFICTSAAGGDLDVVFTITVDDDEGKNNIQFVSGYFTGADETIDVDGWSYIQRVADWYRSFGLSAGNPTLPAWGALCDRDAITIRVRTLDSDGYVNDNELTFAVQDRR